MNVKTNSLLLIRLQRFKSFRRGYFSLLVLLFLYLCSFFNAFIFNDKALVVSYNEKYYFPAFRSFLSILTKKSPYEASLFNQKNKQGEKVFGAPNYRLLQEEFRDTDNFVILPIFPYSPEEVLFDELAASPPTPPSFSHPMGTDSQGRDVLARLVYGFRISISFALLITFCSYLLGTMIGAYLGFKTGKTDLIGMRLIEIISGVPFLFLTMILVSFMKPSFILLAVIIVLAGGWISISYYIRAEFLRERNKEYVLAAVSGGLSNRRIIFKHILPNALTPLITFTPFAIIGYISALVSLDFLGLGLPPPTPSWGELLNQGIDDIHNWWLICFPLLVVFITLLMITFIGESVREAYDPKNHNRII